MSLTEPGAREKLEQELRTFFREKLLPVAEQGKDNGFSFLPAVKDEESWYVAYPPHTPELVDGEDAISEQALQQLWEAQGFPALAELAKPLMELRAKLKPAAEQAKGEVSPFVYAMF